MRATLRIGNVLRDESMESAARRDYLLAACLEIATYLNDHHPNPQRRELVRVLGARVGRCPEIEDAKDILVRDHGITRVDAWALLRRISQRTNRKVRAVAQEIVLRNSGGVPEPEIPAGSASADAGGP